MITDASIYTFVNADIIIIGLLAESVAADQCV